MAHFSYSYPVPTLPAYPYVADLATSVVPPQDFISVPSIDGQVYLYWSKHANTGNPSLDLYTEVWRSQDLVNWDLTAIKQWPAVAPVDGIYSYVDSDVLVGLTYYYRLRFVRHDADAVVFTQSDYTEILGVRIVNALGFEPRDDQANVFFNQLLENLPGTRIYDRTTAATFSADEQLWQTTCRILDGFQLLVDGSVAHEEPADAAALYAKRLVSFIMSKKHVKIQGVNTTEGSVTAQQLVSAYLIHTFIQAYAQQFMVLYDKYQQVVTDKYLAYFQPYARGLNPVVAAQKQAPVNEVYNTIGQFLRLKPLSAQTSAQGIVRYQAALAASFSNILNVGMRLGIDQACSDVLGITTQSVVEYYKQHWFKSDRELKLYKAPELGEIWGLVTTFPDDGSNLVFYWPTSYPSTTLYLEYVLDGTSGISVTAFGGDTADSRYGNDVPPGGLNIDNPNVWYITVHLAPDPITGTTSTAADVASFLLGYELFIDLGIDINFIFGHTGESYIPSAMVPQLFGAVSLWAGWEKTELNLYNRKFLLQDATSTLLTDTALALSSFTISKQSPDNPLPALLPASAPSWLHSTDEYVVDVGTNIGANSLIVARDDQSAGVSFTTISKTVIIGEKRAIIRVDLPAYGMTWITRATLRIFVRLNTAAGYLRLWRVRRRINPAVTCWNFRDTTVVPASGGTLSWTWDGTTYSAPAAAQTLTAKSWTTPGAAGDDDAVFLKEFYVARISQAIPAWVSLDITDVVQELYKYENSRLDMGNDPENPYYTGFMLTADGMPDQSMMVIASSSDSTYGPAFDYEQLPHGFTTCPASATTYFYVDGATRFGRLITKQATAEPVNQIVTVNERIRNKDVFRTGPVTLTLAAPLSSTTLAAGDRICSYTTLSGTGAVGTVLSVSTDLLTLEVQETFHNFSSTSVIYALDADPAKVYPQTVSALTYSGNMAVRLSRMPVVGSTIAVYNAGLTADVATPDEYPEYVPWVEGSLEVRPFFISAVTGTLNVLATQDVDERDQINLNVSDDQSLGGLPVTGDIVVTYQYMYEYVSLGRVVTDSANITDIQGCTRVADGLVIQRESDYQYKTNLLLPAAPAADAVPDISGLATEEYSDHNVQVLDQAVRNIRRQDGPVDVFKQVVEGKPYYMPGQTYHKFFERV